jgi:hypothetical protein
VRWLVFSDYVIIYKCSGKNKYDDGPDCLTMAAEELENGGVIIYG